MVDRFDTRAWLIWVTAAAAVGMLAHNPLYSALLLLVSRLVEWTCGRRDAALDMPMGHKTMLRLAAAIFVFSGLYTGLFVHVGDTTLVTIPEGVPLISGPITLESLLSGFSNGLLLLVLLSFFFAFNRVVTADRLARLAPRAFQDLGIVVLVALTYVPETARHVRRIREAQAVRGHRIEGLRDWQPLLIPLLVGGLERAMALAEAMVARGFGATNRTPLSGRLLGVLALGMGLTFGGWIIALWWEAPGWMLMALGIVSVLGVMWAAGRGVQATRYRRRPWQTRDSLLVAASLAPVVFLVLPLNLVAQESMSFSFMNGLRWPPFEPLVGFLLLLYALPALYGGEYAHEDRYDTDQEPYLHVS